MKKIGTGTVSDFIFSPSEASRLCIAVLTFALSETVPVPIFGGEPGTAGANFLKMGVGPRQIGMGEAQAAAADDVYAAYWNPAGLTRLRYPEVGLMYHQSFEDVSHQYLGYAHPFAFGGVIAAGLTRLSVDSFDSRDAVGGLTGQVNASDTAAGLSYAHPVGKLMADGPLALSLGATLKFVEEKLGRASAQAFGADVGFVVSDPRRKLGNLARGMRFGFVASNLGKGLKFSRDTAPLPTLYKVGAAQDFKVWGDPLLVALDLSAPKDAPVYVSLGAEYWLKRILALRVGYRSGQDEGPGIRAGIGFRIKFFEVDYAFAGFGVLGGSHRAGLKFRLGGPADLKEKTADDFVKRGKNYMTQERYYEAIEQFNEALEMEPGHAVALDLLKRVQALMEDRRKAQGEAPEEEPEERLDEEE